MPNYVGEVYGDGEEQQSALTICVLVQVCYPHGEMYGDGEEQQSAPTICVLV